MPVNYHVEHILDYLAFLAKHGHENHVYAWENWNMPDPDYPPYDSERWLPEDMRW